MSIGWQDIATWLLILAAIAFIGRKAWSLIAGRPKKGSCGSAGGCGTCPSGSKPEVEGPGEIIKIGSLNGQHHLRR
ncbi:hypothetical protein BH23PLA1_BH23PLA1_25030 [soil metagenome]